MSDARCEAHGNLLWPVDRPFPDGAVPYCYSCWRQAGGSRVRRVPVKSHFRTFNKKVVVVRRAAVVRKAAPRRSASPGPGEVWFHLSAHGAGDTMSGMYAACGLADAGYTAVFHTRHTAWLVGCSHPGVRTVQTLDEPGHNASASHRDGELVLGSKREGTRMKWYCDRIADAAGISRFSPSRPRTVVRPAPVLGTGYALLSPFSDGLDREWPPGRWRELAARLLAAGWRVCGTGRAKEKDRLRAVFQGLNVEQHAGNPVSWAVAAVANASLLVVNDSGLAHAAGLHGVPAVAVMSQLTAEFVFGPLAPSVIGVHPDETAWACSPCGWNPARGWQKACKKQCPALASIEAWRVPLPVLAQNEFDARLGHQVERLVGG